jgi:DNA ligase-1
MDFFDLAAVFGKLESTTKRLELTDDLAKLFKEADKRDAKVLAYLCQGVLLPDFHGVEIGLGDKLTAQAIALVAGKPIKEVEASYRKSGDLGDTAASMLEKKTQQNLANSSLSVRKVYDNFYKIATSGGEGSQDTKIKLLAELLSNSSPLEAKVIVRFVTGNLRLGIAEPTILDALSTMAVGDKSLRPDLERAFNLRSDLGLVAELFINQGIEEIHKIGPEPFFPIRPALAERLESAAAIVEKLGRCAVEAKYDGFRIQVHKNGDEVRIYSRRQEPMTDMFPDVVKAVRVQIKAKQCIFEGEAIAYNDATGEFLPFQATIQRKRKHGVAAKAEELPIKLFAFELLYADGKDLTQLAFKERRRRLEKIVKKGDVIAPADYILVKTGAELEKYFDTCVGAGLEGIIAKDLKAPYTAGARKFAWIKFKRSYRGALADTIDAVIVGYYEGKGKRTKFGFGGVLTAIYDEENNRFRTIAKVGSGFDEKEMAQYKEMLDKILVKEKPANVDSIIGADYWVKPQFVVTLNADELTRSPMHAAALGKLPHKDEGLALRFPRLVQLRTDKTAKDATTEREILELFELQKRASSIVEGGE